MLVLQPSSWCDICMEDYELDTLAKSPHAIDCGHILCLTCICALATHTCPLCRNEFQRQNVRKLFIDTAYVGKDNTPPIPDTHASFLLEQLASVSDANSSPGDVLAVMHDVKDWLSKQPGADNVGSIVPLTSALLTLTQIKIHELEFYPPVCEELETLRAVEQSLLSQLAEERTASREVLEYDLRCAQDDVQSLRVDNDHLNTSLQEERAEMNTLRSEIHASQRKAAETLQTTQLVEDSLLAHVRDIEMKCTLKLSVAESEIASLSTKVSRLRNVADVLRSTPPAPPSQQLHTSLDVLRAEFTALVAQSMLIADAQNRYPEIGFFDNRKSTIQPASNEAHLSPAAAFTQSTLFPNLPLFSEPT